MCWQRSIKVKRYIPRFLNIGMEMTEFNFIHLTMEIMRMSFERHLLTSISLLKVNSVVGRKPFSRSSGNSEVTSKGSDMTLEHSSQGDKEVVKPQKVNKEAIWL